MFPLDTYIILVDDMAGARALAAKQLGILGYRKIVEAANGKEALDIIQEKLKANTPIQLVISDLNMPVMDGLELLKKIRSENELKDLPFLMVSAETRPPVILKAMMTGIGNYISKPFSFDVLQRRMMTLWKNLEKVRTEEKEEQESAEK